MVFLFFHQAEGFAVVAVRAEKTADCIPQLPGRGGTSLLDDLSAQDAELHLDLIGPRGVGWRVVQVDVFVSG